MGDNQIQPNGKDQSSTVNILQYVIRIWGKRHFVIKVMCLFIVFGLFIALFSPEVYTGTCTFVPQISSQNMQSSSLSSIAALAGVNLNAGSGEVITPILYPTILNNVDFQKELMYTKFKYNDWEDPISLYDLYTDPKYHQFNLVRFIKKYTIGLPFQISKAISGERDSILVPDEEKFMVALSQDEYYCVKELYKIVDLSVDEKEGSVTISTLQREPLAAAQLTNAVFNLLQKYITAFKIQKAQDSRDFIYARYLDAKADYDIKQLEYAKFSDANKKLSTAIAKTKEQQLKNDLNLSYSVYNEFAKQLVQADIQVKQDTPIFAQIVPVTVPVERTRPRRTVLMIEFFIFGIIFGCALILIYDSLSKMEAVKEPLQQFVKWVRKIESSLNIFKRKRK